MASTPVAMGSSVPAWPAFWASKMRRTIPTTCVEVTSFGLSITTQPWTGVPLRFRAMLCCFRFEGALLPRAAGKGKSQKFLAQIFVAEHPAAGALDAGGKTCALGDAAQVHQVRAVRHPQFNDGDVPVAVFLREIG